MAQNSTLVTKPNNVEFTWAMTKALKSAKERLRRKCARVQDENERRTKRRRLRSNSLDRQDDYAEGHENDSNDWDDETGDYFNRYRDDDDDDEEKDFEYDNGNDLRDYNDNGGDNLREDNDDDNGDDNGGDNGGDNLGEDNGDNNGGDNPGEDNGDDNGGDNLGEDNGNDNGDDKVEDDNSHDNLGDDNGGDNYSKSEDYEEVGQMDFIDNDQYDIYEYLKAKKSQK